MGDDDGDGDLDADSENQGAHAFWVQGDGEGQWDDADWEEAFGAMSDGEATGQGGGHTRNQHNQMDQIAQMKAWRKDGAQEESGNHTNLQKRKGKSTISPTSPSAVGALTVSEGEARATIIKGSTKN